MLCGVWQHVKVWRVYRAPCPSLSTFQVINCAYVGTRILSYYNARFNDKNHILIMRMILFLWRKEEAQDCELNDRQCSSKSGRSRNFAPLESLIKYLKCVTHRSFSSCF
jgi:hypothetical protein